MNRWKLIGLVLAVGALWIGGESLYLGMLNGKKITMSCADFIAERPDHQWFELTECYPDFEAAAAVTVNDKVDELYIPLRGSEESDKPIAVFLNTKEKKLIAAFSDMEDGADEETIGKAVVTIAESLAGPKTIKGLVQFGVALDGEEREMLASFMSGQASDDFVVLDPGKQPHPWRGVLMLLGGLVAIVLIMRSLRKA